MSKSVTLVVLSVLISIALIVGTSTNVSARLKHAFSANTASAHLSVSAVTSMSQNQSFSSGQGSGAASGMFNQSKGDRPQGCHHESTNNPADD